MSRHLVIIPTYQEANTIVPVLEQLRAACDAHVLVVDDGSPDGTADLAEAAGAQLGGVDVLRRGGKSGFGSAYRAGFAWGLERGYEVLVQMDADLSHDPAVVPDLIAGTAAADVVVGSRYVAGGATPDWPWHRRFLSRWANRYAGLMLRVPVRDATAGFRAYRADTLQRLDLSAIRADGYAFQVETIDFAVQAGAVVREIPISFTDREHGQSKMSGRVIAEAIGLVTLWGITRRLPFRRAGHHAHS